MPTLKNWISAARLRTLPLSVSGIIVGTAIAAFGGYFDGNIFSWALITTILYQILSNFANDYGDGVKGTDNMNRVGPQRALQSGAISPLQMKKAVILTGILALFSTLTLVYVSFQGAPGYMILFILMGILAIIAAIKYTVGSNAYGYHGLGDLFVFVFFGWVSVVGVYFLYTKQISWDVFLPGTTIGLLSTGVLNLNNMRDLESDRAAGKNTLAVKLGEKKIRIYHYTILIIAMLTTTVFLWLHYRHPGNLLFLIAYVPILVHLKKLSGTKNLTLLDPELKKLALSTFLLAVLFYMGFNIFS